MVPLMRGIPGILAPRPKREAIVAWACAVEASCSGSWGSIFCWANARGEKERRTARQKQKLFLGVLDVLTFIIFNALEPAHFLNSKFE